MGVLQGCRLRPRLLACWICQFCHYDCWTSCIPEHSVSKRNPCLSIMVFIKKWAFEGDHVERSPEESYRKELWEILLNGAMRLNVDGSQQRSCQLEPTEILSTGTERQCVEQSQGRSWWTEPRAIMLNSAARAFHDESMLATHHIFPPNSEEPYPQLGNTSQLIQVMTEPQLFILSKRDGTTKDVIWTCPVASYACTCPSIQAIWSQRKEDIKLAGWGFVVYTLK